MYASSSLTQAQQRAAVGLFEAGWGDTAVASELGVSRWPVRKLFQRWRVRGRGALVMASGKKVYPFETKVAVAQRFLAGEPKTDLAIEFGLSSPQIVQRWGRILREQGEDGLRPRPRGRKTATGPSNEIETLRREVERLRAENAYLGKLRALMEPQRRSR